LNREKEKDEGGPNSPIYRVGISHREEERSSGDERNQREKKKVMNRKKKKPVGHHVKGQERGKLGRRQR